MTEQDQIAKKNKKLLTALQSSAVAGGRDLVDRRVKAILNSVPARIMASRGFRRWASWDEIKEFAGSWDPYNVGNEPIRAVNILKKSGSGTRPLQIFGAKRKAANVLVAQILGVTLPVNPVEYCTKSRGTKEAITKLKSMMMDPTITHIVVGDLINFYPSIRGDQLHDLLLLPEAVTNAVVLGLSTDQPEEGEGKDYIASHVPYPCFPFPYGDVPTAATSAPFGADPLGLPQGVATSAIIASRVALAKLATLPFSDRLVLYADDIAGGAQGEDEAMSVQSELEDVCASSPVGPLPRTFHIIPKSKKVRFLGRVLKYRPKNGDVRVTVDWPSFERFKDKIAVRWDEDIAEGGEAFARWALDEYTKRWFAGYPDADRDEFSEWAIRRAQRAAIPDQGYLKDD